MINAINLREGFKTIEIYSPKEIIDLLHQEMYRRCSKTLGGTIPSDIANGINSYLRATTTRRALMSSASWSVVLTNRMIFNDSLDKDRPCIVFTMIYPGTYSKHITLFYCMQ